MTLRPLRLLHIMTVPESFHFLRGQIRFMRHRGIEIGAVASPGPSHAWFREQEGVETEEVTMSRRFTPASDLLALLRLVVLLRRRRPDIVHAHTPKAGLLGMIAAYLTRVPVRIYHLRGLPFLTTTGPRHVALIALERISCRLAHRVICVSHSLREVALDHHLCSTEKIVTFMSGSGNGVDAEVQFRPEPSDVAIRDAIRRGYGIPSDAPVIGFVGRLVRDKGLVELAKAWELLSARFPDAHLLLVGGAESGVEVAPLTMEGLRADARVHFAGAVEDVRSQYVAMDIVTLPSYREGFPNVVLEASAMALPVVTSTAPGCIDAVVNGETGLTVAPGNPVELFVALSQYLEDPALRRRHGEHGRRRVLRDFSRDAIWQALYEEYERLAALRLRGRSQDRAMTTRVVARLLHITTVPETLGFFRGQVGFMKRAGLSVEALSSPSTDLTTFGTREGIAVYGVPMKRSISPFADLWSLWGIMRTFRHARPHIVHAHTPKGGLLGMLAARLTGVPVRIYHIHGLRFTTAKGLTRILLRWTEQVSCLLAQQVFCVSHSVSQVAVAEKICPPSKISVFLGGSINGVDALVRFNPTGYGTAREDVRSELGIPSEAFVAGFVGRLVRDKGVSELIAAWQLLRDELPQLHLVVVGPFESEDPLPRSVVEILRTDQRIHLTGAADPPRLLAAMDLVVLPTYREGFPNVPLEAAAMGLPVLATRVPGCTDAVVEDVTGCLVPAGNARALASAVRDYVQRPSLGREQGKAGRERVMREFAQEAIWRATLGAYERMLAVQNVI